MLTADLADGATVEWPAVHGDEAVYVVDGALEIDGRRSRRPRVRQ